ncbi:hypothetical protein CU026_1915 [Enterococcus faecium]|nr:hypothetical protein EfmE1679_1118 [Enterococcus faecium E1679]EFR69796.1 hypothetical protein HMPREF9524_00010 [Enterococcus faecium TX0133a01]EFR70647.1 hypothetical protein HMPREF9526_02297 [Enterococcus faecium TX0133B]EFR77554.1 hypothetical protein HMPREF9527_01588 [Enterococcus faecium TX0133C]EJX47206.1 hypothetical protein HMPREF1380_02324 [Enterococcus faecium R499]EJX55033.1 hypothetical protein HMPREF1377_02257 [Enterococcus faecium R494]EJX61235.1 hypothetical protein HMPREF13
MLAGVFLCGSQVVFSSAVFHDTIKNHVYKEIGNKWQMRLK